MPASSATTRPQRMPTSRFPRSPALGSMTSPPRMTRSRRSSARARPVSVPKGAREAIATPLQPRRNSRREKLVTRLARDRYNPSPFPAAGRGSESERTRRALLGFVLEREQHARAESDHLSVVHFHVHLHHFCNAQVAQRGSGSLDRVHGRVLPGLVARP